MTKMHDLMQKLGERIGELGDPDDEEIELIKAIIRYARQYPNADIESFEFKRWWIHECTDECDHTYKQTFELYRYFDSVMDSIPETRKTT